MRVFLEKFTDDFADPSINCIGYKLFNSNGNRTFHAGNFLRSCTNNKREIFSDVFIFERSDSSEFFNLVVLKSGLTKENWDKYPSEVSFTIGVAAVDQFMSFMKIDVVEIPFQVASREVQESLQLSPLDFGGPMSSPLFINNPTFILDVEEKSNFHFALEASTASINCRIYLMGVPPDLEDIKCISHGHLDSSYSSGLDTPGISELNCELEPGRYLLVASLANRQAVEGRLELSVNSWAKAFSEHPCVREKMTPFTEQSFSLMRAQHSERLKSLKHHKNRLDCWRVSKLPGMKKLQGDSYSEFLRNPGALLKFSKAGVFRFHLSSSSYSSKFAAAAASQSLGSLQKPPYLTVCLLRVRSLNRYDVILDDQDYSAAAWGYWTA